MKSDPAERKRLFSFFRHRPYTLVSIMKECLKKREENKGMQEDYL